MKRVSKKQRLVDYMIASGNNGFTYTEVIKTLLKFRFGDDFKYDHKLHRGYYACSISGINNYMMNGAGKCGLEKRDGKYFAKYFDKTERLQRARKELMRKMQFATQYVAWYYPLTQEDVMEKTINRLTKNYMRSMKMIKKETASEPSGY